MDTDVLLPPFTLYGLVTSAKEEFPGSPAATQKFSWHKEWLLIIMFWALLMIVIDNMNTNDMNNFFMIEV